MRVVDFCCVDDKNWTVVFVQRGACLVVCLHENHVHVLLSFLLIIVGILSIWE